MNLRVLCSLRILFYNLAWVNCAFRGLCVLPGEQGAVMLRLAVVVAPCAQQRLSQRTDSSFANAHTEVASLSCALGKGTWWAPIVHLFYLIWSELLETHAVGVRYEDSKTDGLKKMGAQFYIQNVKGGKLNILSVIVSAIVSKTVQFQNCW
jgi:hypothetical protein